MFNTISHAEYILSFSSMAEEEEEDDDMVWMDAFRAHPSIYEDQDVADDMDPFGGIFKENRSDDYEHSYNEEDDIDIDNHASDESFSKTLLDIKASDWKEDKSAEGKTPLISLDQARDNNWKHAKEEINMLLKKLDAVEFNATRTDESGIRIEKFIDIVFGSKSRLYFLISEIKRSITFEEYIRWICSFFFSCSLNMSYSEICKNDRIDTRELCSEEEYLDLWKRIEEHNKGSNFKKRSWALLQKAYNELMVNTFMPDPNEIKLGICLDDDKAEYDYKKLRLVPVDEDSDLGRHRHMKVNKRGFIGHIFAFVGSGVVFQIQFQR